METTTSLPRTRKVPLRNGKITRETLNFRRVARQVMLANMFTRKTTNGHYVKSTLSSKRTAISQDQVPHRLVTKRERKHSNNMAENPPLKRRGTPELFPMSEEMKQIVISLIISLYRVFSHDVMCGSHLFVSMSFGKLPWRLKLELTNQDSVGGKTPTSNACMLIRVGPHFFLY